MREEENDEITNRESQKPNMKESPQMKSVFIGVLAMLLISLSDIWAFDPPKGLKWGMSYDDCGNVVSQPKGDDEPLKLGKLKKGKNDKGAVTAFDYADIKTVKLFEKKAKTAYAMFDSSGGLCQVNYSFSWDNDDEKGQDIFSKGGTGREKCYQMHGKLVDGLRGKYGEPAVEPKGDIYGTTIAHGVALETMWKDTSSNTMIGVVLTRNKTNLVIGTLDQYIVQLIYLGPAAMASYEAEVQTNEDL